MNKKLLSLVLLLSTTFSICSCKGGETSSYSSNVSSTTLAINGITITANNNARNIKVGETLQLTAKAYPEGVNQEFIWASSNEAIATVSSNGLVSGVAVGNVNIIAIAKSDESVTQSYALVIEEAAVVDVVPESITITAENNLTTIKVGEKLNLTAIVLPKEANQSVNWSSSDTNLAIVNRGEVSAISEGIVTISAKSKEYPEVSQDYELTIEKSDDPVYTLDWEKMEYTSHEKYMTSDDEEPLKIKGIVTHVSPVNDENLVNYYIQNGTEGYYIYNQNNLIHPVEEGKSYEVGGFKKYYRGTNEIVNVEYFKSLAENCEYSVTDVNNKDVTSKDEMSIYHSAYISANAVINSLPTIATKAYSVDVKINGHDIDLRIDPANMESSEFTAINNIFNKTVSGSKITLKGVMSAFGYGTPSNQIQILKSKDLTVEELSDLDILNAVYDSLNIVGSININETTIDLPTTSELFDKVKITWSSDNSAVIDVETGNVTHSEKDEVVTLTATLTCGNEEKEKEFKVTVFGTNNTFETKASLNLEDAAAPDSYGNSATKSGYKAAEVQLGTPSLTWYIDQALISGSNSDRHNGTFALRAKSGKTHDSTGRIEVRNDDEYNVVQFAAAVYGNDNSGIQIGVEYSLDSGTTWVDSESIVTINSTDLETYRISLPSGEKRIAIYVVENTGNRVNIDDILLMK